MLLSQSRSPQTSFESISRFDSIVFIDPSVDDVQQLINGIRPEREISILNWTEDGIKQISQVLQKRRNLKAVHLVSHGSPGCLYLGNSVLNLSTLAQYESYLKSWKKAFSADCPVLLLYGCQVAAGEAGTEFVKRLRELTGINLSASATLTGNRELGGDWELEVRTGEIETSLAFSEAVRETYASVLATYTVNTLEDENDGIEDGEISLREAIQVANSSAEVDTIEFEAGLSGGTITLVNGELRITDDLTIEGLGAENLTISANNSSRVFKVDDGNSDNEIEVVVDGLTISYGRSDDGGGIRNLENLTVINSTVFSNHAGTGGGLYNTGTLTVIDSTVSSNSASANGGGGFYNTGILIVSNSTVSSNYAFYGNGGGLSNSGTLSVINSRISGNYASAYYYNGYLYGGGQGGGIDNRDNLTIINSIVSDNSADEGGDGIDSHDLSNLTIINSTISDNSNSGISTSGNTLLINSTITQNSNGIVAFGSVQVQVGNSIISGNSLADVTGSTSNFSSQGNNLIGTGNALAAFNQAGDVTGIGDPRLEPLADNGGATFTHALKPDSPAINTGNNALLPPDTADLDGDGNTSEPLPVDQRGEPRIQGGTVDIGAFESSFTGVPSPIVSLTVSQSIAFEGEESVVYRLSRTGSVNSALEIQLSAVGSEGLTLDDFNLTGVTGTFPNFTVTFAAGKSQAELTLSAVEDSTLEAGETLAINLVENDSYKINSVNNSGTVSIFNQVLLVSNTNDSGIGSLRQAILDANAIAGANTIVFAESLNGQTITITSGELNITDDLTIDGLGAENLTISGNNNSRIFSISQNNKDVEIEGLTLTDGSSADGGAIFNRGDLTLRNSIITGNTASNRGGSIYNWGEIVYNYNYFNPIDIYTSSLAVIDSVISGNTANSGGGLFNQFSGVILNNSTLSGNTANIGGGAIYSNGRITKYYYTPGSLTISNSTITDNTADSGGGIFNNISEVQVIDSIISGNQAYSGGGGILNRSDYDGEGYIVSSGTLRLSNSTISDNQASSGGGIGGNFRGNTALILTNSTISGNQADFSGGGILGYFEKPTNKYDSRYSQLILNNSTVSGNTAGSDGGGIWSSFQGYTQLEIFSSTISGNTADANGGGLFTSGSTDAKSSSYYGLVIANSTISGNTANEDGGGIFNSAEDLQLTNNTITANTASSEGGGIFNEDSITVGNTIIAANTDNPDIAGNPFTSAGFNLIANGDGASGFNNTGDQVGTSSNPINPLLGPLQNNGGPTDTHALLEGSPAIDAGSNDFVFGTDQRGEPRTQGLRVDIGSYESFSAISRAVLTFSALTGNPAEANTTPGTLTLRRENNTNGELVVNFSLGGNASLGDDYTLSNVNLNNNTLIFADGQSSLDITLTPIDDNLFDPYETVQLNLLPGSGYVLGSVNSVSKGISDNDLNVTLSAFGNPSEANTTPATLRLSRQGNTNDELVVNFSLGGTATLGVDYTLSNVNISDNTLIFADGQSSLDITLTPIDDNLFDPNETVEFNLISGSGYVLEIPNSASLTILDNDFNIVNGTSQSETLTGTDFSDRFNGRGGDDTFIGELGNDRYTVNSLGDVVVERPNQGNDTVNSLVTYTLSADVENLTLTGKTNINGKGNSLGNVLKGNGGNNRLQGLAGNDTLIGGAGNDKLVGGAGNDTLTGGVGADQFLFSGTTLSRLGVDTLTDFTRGSDKLVLSQKIFSTLETISGTLVESELAAIRVELAQEMAIAGVSSANLVYNSRSGNLFYNANGADEGFGEGGLLASLTRKPSSLEVSDFLVQV